MEPRGPILKVDLIFAATPWLKQFIRERLWHRSQTFEDLPDGRLRMRMQVKGKPSSPEMTDGCQEWFYCPYITTVVEFSVSGRKSKPI